MQIFKNKTHWLSPNILYSAQNKFSLKQITEAWLPHFWHSASIFPRAFPILSFMSVVLPKPHTPHHTELFCNSRCGIKNFHIPNAGYIRNRKYFRRNILLHLSWADSTMLNTQHFRPASKLRKPIPDFDIHSNKCVD